MGADFGDDRGQSHVTRKVEGVAAVWTLDHREPGVMQRVAVHLPLVPEGIDEEDREMLHFIPCISGNCKRFAVLVRKPRRAQRSRNCNDAVTMRGAVPCGLT